LGKTQKKTSPTKNEDVFYPITILECPPIKILSVRFYKTKNNTKTVSSEFIFKPDKELMRKIPVPKKVSEIKKLDEINPDDFTDITLTVYTQPKLIKLKKKPEIFEIHLAGSNKEKLDLIKNNLNKDIHFKDVFEEGEFVDIHGITKGKGNQGPVKRFGIDLKPHKSEKSRRNPGSLGGWKAQGHVMYRVAHAGQTGYQQRTEYSKQIFKISNDPKEINPKGGFLRRSPVKQDYTLVKGSTFGPAKRMLILTKSLRKQEKESVPTIQYISKTSRQ